MTRQALHRLIEDLPEEELQPAARYLEFLVHRESEDAWDDPSYQKYTMAQVQVAEAEFARGESISLQNARKHFPNCFGE